MIRLVWMLLLSGLVEAQQLTEADFFSRTRRLTFEGRRAGEGYFSPDGKKMVFQSERIPDNPFYQIYVLNLETGDTDRISPGYGKTTCAFFQHDTEHVLYSSTHHDPNSQQLQKEELEIRASGRERRYSWDYDPEMELYVQEKSDTPRRLTNVYGYDAEASYSPDGQWVVFTSTRDVYGRDLTREEELQLERDPAYFAEIYIMRADGQMQTRLTYAPGYDGGPFFSHGGRFIVWRRFTERGDVADIWRMTPTGSDQRMITDFKSMSWAPYTHPSGRYIIFSSNKLGFENFELFIVDFDGTKEPVRVTYTEGFDGLPVPAPSGEQISWTSTRGTNSSDGGQIYLADWNHDKAIQALADAPLRGEEQ